MTEDSIRRLHLLKKIKESKHKIDKVNVFGVLSQTLTVEQLRAATLRGEVVIDKFLTLSYPLNDPRTSPTLRALYIRQEEMMMEHVEEDEVMPSSRSK
jgi:hypothetical protein